MTRKSQFIFWALLILGWVQAQAQDNPLRLDAEQYDQLERLRVKYRGESPFFPGNHSLSRKRIARFIAGLPADRLDESDLNALRYFVDELPEWFTDSSFIQEYLPAGTGNPEIFAPLKRTPVLRYFYEYPSEFLFIRKKDLFLSVNPLLQFKYGRQKDGQPNIFENRRGIALRAGIENKIFIDTKIEEVQFGRPDYIERYIEKYHSAPGYTFYTNTNLLPSLPGHDAFDAEAYLTLPAGRYASAQFGYGRHFIGQGIQSLLLSDFGGNYLNLKLELEIWKIKYQYLVAELTGVSRGQVRGDQLLPKKYMATHFLQIDLWENARIGLFESVVFNRDHQLEWHYLLPVVFFRTIERALGSPDNILMGLDFSWDLWEKYQWYSQFVLDEFKAKELFGGRQWWANKWGLQTGLKVYDVLKIPNLNATAEYNTVRPYTYGHRDSLATYAHYNSPLAHPLGANFREYIFKMDYYPGKRWALSGLIYHHKQGLDEHGIDYGADLRIANNTITRPGDHGIYTLQGKKQAVTGLQGTLSYKLWHNAWLDFHTGFRQENKNKNLWGSVAFRLNTGKTGSYIF